MRELTEKEMNLVAGGIARPIGEDGANITNPFPLESNKETPSECAVRLETIIQAAADECREGGITSVQGDAGSESKSGSGSVGAGNKAIQGEVTGSGTTSSDCGSVTVWCD